MKKSLSLLVALIMILSAFPAFAIDFSDADIYLYFDYDGALPDGVTSYETTFLDGVKGGGLQFNGTSSRLTLPDNITSGVTDFTFATWLWLDYDNLNFQRIFDFGSGTNNYFFLGIMDSGSFVIGEKVNGSSEYRITATGAAVANEWTHVAFVQDGNTATIYLNGVAVKSGEARYSLKDLGNTNQNYIGDSQFSADPSLSGLLDETVFVSRALSSDEIAELAEYPATSEEYLYNLVNIYDCDDIRDNLYLPPEVDGATVTWVSSDPATVQTAPIQNGTHTMPAGIIERGEEDKNVTLTATIEKDGISVEKTFELTVKAKPVIPEKTAYIYAYFRGVVNGSKEHLQIHLATSEDGLTWTDLNGNYPILASDVGTRAVRDPYLMRSKYGDKFYLIATDLNTLDGAGWAKWSLTASKYLTVWESDDLVNWSDARLVKFGDEFMGCAWAPECIYDHTTGEYLVYASGKNLHRSSPIDTVFIARTRDFRTFSKPEIYVGGGSTAYIDTSMIYAEEVGKYYRFSKENSSYVTMEVADEPFGTWTKVPGYTNIGGEGPAIFKFNGNNTTYCLMVDDYSKYNPYFTDDIASGIFEKRTSKMPTGSKHGVVLPITTEEYQNLLAAYGAVVPDESLGEPVVKYDFEYGIAGDIRGDARIEHDDEIDSNVLVLDGEESYLAFEDDLFLRRDNFTLSFDVKADTEGGDAFAIGRDSDRYFYFDPADDGFSSAITITAANYEEKAADSSASGLLGKWTHYDIVSEPYAISIYRDGFLAATKKFTKTISHLGVDEMYAYLGKSFNKSAYFRGSFDNVALYNYAMTPADIASINGFTDARIAALDADGFTTDLSAVSGDIVLPTTGNYGSEIIWTSSNEAVIAPDGTVNVPESGSVNVMLTATYTYGSATIRRQYKATVVSGVWYSTYATDWAYHEFDPVTGDIVVTYNVTPLAVCDGVMSLYGSDNAPSYWSGMNMVVRLTKGSRFDAYNNNGFAYVNNVNYVVGKTYTIRIESNIASKTYDVYVTDENGTTTQIADKYVYRATAPAMNDAGRFTACGGDGAAAREFYVTDFSAVSIEQSGTCGDNAAYALTGDGVLTISGSGSVTAFSPFVDVSKIKKIVVKDGITDISCYDFMEASALESIEFATSVESIGTYVFYGSGLKELNIGSGVKTITDGAFFQSESLATVSLPKSVEAIGSSAFGSCNAISRVIYEGTNAEWEVLKSAIGADNDALLNASVACMGEVPAEFVISQNDGGALIGAPGDVSATVLFAYYKDGALVCVESRNVLLNAGWNSVSPDFPIEADSVKVMAWNGFFTLSPLAKAD